MHALIVGLGSIGRRHATNIAQLCPDARFTFVRRRDEQDELTNALGARVVGSIAEVTDDPVDLAVIATPSASHIDVLPALIERGCGVLVEKPIVSSVEDCDRVERLIGDSPSATRVAGFNLRYLPSLARAKNVLDDGALGRVSRASFVAGQWLPDWRPHLDYRRSYSADASRGGGVELDLSHEFDVARWLFGELEVEFARGTRDSSLELCSNDTSLSVLSSRADRRPLITIAVDYLSRRPVRRYELVGDRATLIWSLDGVLELHTTTGVEVLAGDEQGFDMSSTYVTMVSKILSAIDGGESEGLQDLSDGIESTRLALAARDRGSG